MGGHVLLLLERRQWSLYREVALVHIWIAWCVGILESGVFTLDDPSQETQAGFFGNDGDMCDAMDGQGCGELIKNNVRAEGIYKGLFVGVNNYPSSGGKNPMF